MQSICTLVRLVPYLYPKVRNLTESLNFNKGQYMLLNFSSIEGKTGLGGAEMIILLKIRFRTYF